MTYPVRPVREQRGIPIRKNLVRIDSLPGKTNLEQTEFLKRKWERLTAVGYVYHGTFYDRLAGIKREGLLPGADKNFDISGKYVYLCQMAFSAGFWVEYLYIMGDPARLPVLLRIKESDLTSDYVDYDELGSRFSGETCLKYKQPIPPDKIEVYLDKKNIWVKLI